LARGGHRLVIALTVEYLGRAFFNPRHETADIRAAGAVAVDMPK
jgi:hypothetical protein